jgi:uncharacterized surface protein with fasciclin (FAS1) repeats
MKIRYKQIVLLYATLLSLYLLSGCSKAQDERNNISNEGLKMNLFELVSANSQLSTFKDYLVRTGYDKVIASSKTFTVFAPANSVLASLDPAIVNDPSRLKKFIGNHIATQVYRTADLQTQTRIGMLNGKYVNMKGKVVEDATIVTSDLLANNGLLQVIDKALPALDNCWEFVTTSTEAPAKQKNFMLSLFRKVFDITNAVVSGVNPVTGDPIYQPGTDSIFTNLFLNRVHDLQDERKQYTLFMLSDAAWDIEVAKFTPFFVTNTADSNTLVTSWNVVRDFAVDTVYEPSSLPSVVVSKFGTALPIDRTAIVRSIKTSNGIIYIMNRLDVQPASKFKTITIEAERFVAQSANRLSSTFLRDRFNPLTGLDFRDVLVLNHGLALFNLRYDIPEVPSIRYRAFWVAVNDFQAVTHTQRLGVGSPTSTALNYITVPLNSHAEAFIGEFTLTRYSPVLNLFLTAANSTANAANPLVCDYIKLVPSL